MIFIRLLFFQFLSFFSLHFGGGGGFLWSKTNRNRYWLRVTSCDCWARDQKEKYQMSSPLKFTARERTERGEVTAVAFSQAKDLFLSFYLFLYTFFSFALVLIRPKICVSVSFFKVEHWNYITVVTYFCNSYFPFCYTSLNICNEFNFNENVNLLRVKNCCSINLCRTDKANVDKERKKIAPVKELKLSIECNDDDDSWKFMFEIYFGVCISVYFPVKRKVIWILIFVHSSFQSTTPKK